MSRTANPTPVPRLPRLFPVSTICAAANIPRTRIYEAIAKGELPVVRLSDNRGRGPAGMRLDERDVERWLASRREVAR